MKKTDGGTTTILSLMLDGSLRPMTFFQDVAGPIKDLKASVDKTNILLESLLKELVCSAKHTERNTNEIIKISNNIDSNVLESKES